MTPGDLEIRSKFALSVRLPASIAHGDPRREPFANRRRTLTVGFSQRIGRLVREFVGRFLHFALKPNVNAGCSLQKHKGLSILGVYCCVAVQLDMLVAKILGTLFSRT
jgi:hypothetical protein